MSGPLSRFLGDSPLRVIFKLVLISFVVGLAMASLGWSPWDVFYAIQDFFYRIWSMGFATLDRFVGYMLLGAAIVVPAFLLLRILNFRK